MPPNPSAVICAEKQATAKGIISVSFPVISMSSTMPVKVAWTTPVKYEAIPTTANSFGSISRPGKRSWLILANANSQQWSKYQNGHEDTACYARAGAAYRHDKADEKQHDHVQIKGAVCKNTVDEALATPR